MRGCRRRRCARLVQLIFVLVLLTAACGSSPAVVDMGAAPTRPPADNSSAPAQQVPAPAGSEPGLRGAGGTSEAAAVPQGTTTLQVWLVDGEQATPVAREVPRVPRIGAAVMEALLAGPTAAERAGGLSTEIPAATRLRGLTITGGVATVDLSGDFERGGGTLGLTLRLAQVVCTLDQFPTVDGVRFALDGVVVDVFSGDGLIIDEPVSCSDYAAVVAG